MKKLILYSKPGCHLCEGLQEKLAELPLDLDIRDITTNETWFQKYQYEIPVLCVPPDNDHENGSEQPLPRIAPRASLARVEQMIQKYIGPLTA
ncbi:MAG: glutaredoxin family protein [Cyanobacteria bacterium P01_D01_bin.105]